MLNFCKRKKGKKHVILEIHRLMHKKSNYFVYIFVVNRRVFKINPAGYALQS